MKPNRSAQQKITGTSPRFQQQSAVSQNQHRKFFPASKEMDQSYKTFDSSK